MLSMGIKEETEKKHAKKDETRRKKAKKNFLNSGEKSL